MERREASVGDGALVIGVRTQPALVSGWHHDGDHATFGYVVAGSLRLEFGPGGREVVEAGPGGYFYVPPHTVHRESNPAGPEQVLAGFPMGSGPTVVNVEAPDDG